MVQYNAEGSEPFSENSIVSSASFTPSLKSRITVHVFALLRVRSWLNLIQRHRIFRNPTHKIHTLSGTIPANLLVPAEGKTVNPTKLQAALFAPEEYMALFSCTAGELSYTPDSLRYLGVLAWGVDRTPSAG